ncbi:cytochrome bd-I oxidase subunit CydX [Xylophilus sp. GOD-11R]|nr:cytochrome bd-I oxidase subunit CydX [Xylophilus sp. GOD-11R]WPB58091.1 cytochrome bd-I oxidase subunit CydX [Xylophilus sp. GOD-11R]
MWYFAWILGVGLAVGFGVLNGVWHEFHLPDEQVGKRGGKRDPKRVRA